MKIRTENHRKKFISFLILAEQWKLHRRLVSPSISLTSVSAHLPIFNQHIREAMNKLPVINGYFDILPYLLTCKISMFAEAALGSEIEPSVKQKYLNQFSAYVFDFY